MNNALSILQYRNQDASEWPKNGAKSVREKRKRIQNRNEI
jgi:hypothetical protein